MTTTNRTRYRSVATALALCLMAVVGTIHAPGADPDGKPPAPKAAGMVFDVSEKGPSLVVKKFENAASGHRWVEAGVAIGPCLVQSTGTTFFADPPGDFEKAAVEIRPGKRGLDLLAARWVRKDGLELAWSAQTVDATGMVEFQAEVRNTGEVPIPKLLQLGPLSARLAADPKDLVVHYVSRNDYRKQMVPIPPKGLDIQGGDWNSPAAAGWVAIENRKAHEILFLGVEWESYWTVRLTAHPEGGTVLQCFLNTLGHDLTPRSSLVSPRIFLGLSHGDLDDSLRGLHDHLRRIMPPMPKDFPWVAYDIWATEATGVEQAILAEIPFAARLGVDLFYIDASWYEGSDKTGAGNWFAGVGNYAREDRVKYPGGLAAISKKVHDSGMKFGLWFAPQVVDAKLVGTEIPPEFVAKRHGKDIRLSIWNTPIVQICTGNPKVVEHLKKVLGDAVDRYALDWVKWDNSGLPGDVCDRADHGHQAADGALAALRGQYEIWRRLRERFPKLMIEECGYPSRLDYGLARTATSHWLADSTGTALGVRQGQLHAGYVYPAAHNTAWVLDGEGAKDAAALDTVVRSRMMGLCGVGTLHGKLGERASLLPPEVLDALARNFKVYKQYRHLLRQDVYHLLPPSTTADAWDAIQFCQRDGSEAAVLAFRSKSSESAKVLALRGLRPDVVYELKQVNSGQTQTVKGKQLGEGVKIVLPAQDMSEILLLKVRHGPG